MPSSLELSEPDIRDTKRLLFKEGEEAIQAFVSRQVRAQERVSLLSEFIVVSPAGWPASIY